jgi:glycosyltransferase involved in cell wall biosynthesis
MAEAMCLGIPAIATNWSSNTDFMKPDNSCLVDFRFTDVKDQYYQSRQGQRWADPDIGHAAAYMKQLFSDKSFYDRIAHAGQAFIQTEYSVHRSAQILIARLQEIGVLSRR